MVRISGSTILITQGDTLKTEIKIYNSDGEIYEIQEGDVIVFGVKKNISDESLLITKTISNETRILQLDSADTNTLEPGDYLYDLEITFENGDVSTIINCGKLKIKEQVVNHD